MPHFEANSQVILKREDVPEGLTLEKIATAMVNKQFPVKFKKGAVSYEIGMLITSVLGRDAIVGDIGLDPVFTLIVDKEIIPPTEEELEKDPKAKPTEIVHVKHLEWTT